VKAVESVRHELSLAVRIDDHFTGEPWPAPALVELDTGEPAVATADGRSRRHADGTYRFVKVTPGVRTVTVTPGGGAFTWSASTTVDLATFDRSQALAIEVWPAPGGRAPSGTLAVRGRLAGPAPLGGLEVRIEVVGAPARNRRSRSDASGEFLFIVAGAVETSGTDQAIELDVTVPGRTVASIQIIDGATDPVTAGHIVRVRPGRELRARINLS
jgi:hypothetical protein